MTPDSSAAGNNVVRCLPVSTDLATIAFPGEGVDHITTESQTAYVSYVKYMEVYCRIP